MKISHTFLLFIKGAFSSFCKLSKLFQIFMSPTTIVVYKIINRCNAKRLNNMESSVVVVIFCETTRIAYIKYKIPSRLYEHKWPSGQSSRLLLQYSSCQWFYPCWGFNQDLIFNLCLVIHWGPWRFPYMHVIKIIIILDLNNKDKEPAIEVASEYCMVFVWTTQALWDLFKKTFLIHFSSLTTFIIFLSTYSGLTWNIQTSENNKYCHNYHGNVLLFFG